VVTVASSTFRFKDMASLLGGVSRKSDAVSSRHQRLCQYRGSPRDHQRALRLGADGARNGDDAGDVRRALGIDETGVASGRLSPCGGVKSGIRGQEPAEAEEWRNGA